MNPIISLKDLAAVRERHAGKKIVFCSGTFDLPHAGHVLFLEDCKKYGDILVVGVGCDSIIKTYKGPTRPVLNEQVRVKIISAFKPVDYAFIDEPRSQENILVFLNEVFEKLKPNTYVFNTDAFNIPYREEISKKHGVRAVALDRWCPPAFEKISTSAIISRIGSDEQKKNPG